MAFACRKGQMGDTQDGSPSAAQSAQPEASDETGPRPGSEPNFLKKIFNVFGGSEDTPPGAMRPRRQRPRTGRRGPCSGSATCAGCASRTWCIPKAEIVAVPGTSPSTTLVRGVPRKRDHPASGLRGHARHAAGARPPQGLRPAATASTARGERFDLEEDAAPAALCAAVDADRRAAAEDADGARCTWRS